MVKARKRALVSALVSTAALCAGCEVVLGIEEARVDPSLSPSKAGTGGSNAAAGSSAGGSKSGGAGGTDSSGGTNSDGGTSGATGGSAGAPQKTLCEEYCEELMTNCESNSDELLLAQYADVAQCLAVCALFEPGEEGDRGVNTIQCRLTRARSAKSEPSIDCPRAGPAPGTAGCGTPCEAYCTLMMGACNEQTTLGEDGYFFEDYESCTTACEQVPDTVPYVFDPNPLGNVFSGDHLACRMYHVVVASEGDFEHCDHAIGGSICTP